MLAGNKAIWISVISFESNICEIISRIFATSSVTGRILCPSVGKARPSVVETCPVGEDEQLGSESREGCDPPPAPKSSDVGSQCLPPTHRPPINAAQTPTK